MSSYQSCLVFSTVDTDSDKVLRFYLSTKFTSFRAQPAPHHVIVFGWLNFNGPWVRNVFVTGSKINFCNYFLSSLITLAFPTFVCLFVLRYDYNHPLERKKIISENLFFWLLIFILKICQRPYSMLMMSLANVLKLTILKYIFDLEKKDIFVLSF